MKIKKGDKVKIVAGKDAGKEGTIERVYPKQNKVLILGRNMYKRHLKRTDQTQPAGIVDVPRPLGIAKIRLVCPKCKKMTRVGYNLEKGKKFRICKKCRSKI